MKKPIGRIIATEKVPTTMDKFTFWTDSDLKLHAFDIVKVSYTNQATNQATDQTNQDEDNSVPARILKVIETKPMLSQRKIADIIGEKYSTVKYYMESMKKSGIIKREGSSQKGKWIIL